MSLPTTRRYDVKPGDRFPMRYEDFWGWDPEFRAEWVNGEAIIYQPHWLKENQIMMLLACLLGNYLRAFDLGEVFSNGLGMDIPSRPSVRLPDVLVILKEHAGRLTHEGLMGPADIVFELVSDDTYALDYVEKFNEYEEAGVKEYVLIDTRSESEAFNYFRLDAEGRYQPVIPESRGRYHSAMVRGFWIDPAWFWRDPLPSGMEITMKIGGDAYWNYLQGLINDHESRR